VSWYNDNPQRWLREQEIAAEILTDFEPSIDGNGNATFHGDLELCSEHGHVYESVRISVVYPSTFPARNQPPSVYLESHRNRWKNVADSHIESDWKLCLFVPGESGIAFADGDSLKKLLGVIHTFLLKERIYQRRLAKAQRTGEIAEWPGPDRTHGLEGIREAIRDMGRVGRNDPCPCGSGLKFKKCHLGKL
jgi:hypothetical protein